MIRNVGPQYMGSSAGNIYNPASGVWGIIRVVHFCNESASDQTFYLYKGASGGSTGGTTYFYGFTIKANSTYDWPCYIEMGNSSYLTGYASQASAVSITVSVDEDLTPAA